MHHHRDYKLFRQFILQPSAKPLSNLQNGTQPAGRASFAFIANLLRVILVRCKKATLKP
jgi:hypothetical protein